MATEQSSAIGRRRLRLELRRARDAANLTQEQVSGEMDWSLSKLNRIESGAVSVSTNDLKALLRLYRIDDPDRIKQLTDLARASRHAPPWWSEYRDLITEPYRKFLEFEAASSVIRHFNPLLIPGLYQTREYARTIVETISPTPVRPEHAERYVEIRMMRQLKVFGRDRHQVTVLVGEAALRQQVGGPEVMRQQLDALLKRDRPRGTLRVVPFDSGGHPGLAGGFGVLEFADPHDPDVLYLESAPNVFVEHENPEMVESYLSAFSQLEELALSPSGSASLIARVIGELS